MMKRHQPRWLVWLLILCVGMSGLGFAAAEEAAPSDAERSMIVAMDLNAGMVDAELYSAAMSLLRPGLTIARLRKCRISVLDTVGDVKETYKGRDVDEAQKFLEHIGTGTIGDVRQHLAKTAAAISRAIPDGASGDLFVVSRLERLNRTSRQQASENEFYNAYESLLDKAPDMSVHFIWLSDKKTGTAIDEELANAYPGRVTAIVLSRDTADEQTIQELTRMAGATFTLRRSVDGMTVQDGIVTIPFSQEITGDVLLRLVLDGDDPMPDKVALKSVTPDGRTADMATTTPEVTELPEVELPDLIEIELPEDTAIATPEVTELPEVELLDALEFELDDDEATAAPGTDEPAETNAPGEGPVRALCIDERTRTVWFAAGQLPQGDYRLELAFDAGADGVRPTLTTYLLNKEPVLELSAEQADDEPERTWFREPHTLTLTMDLPLIGQEGFTPALELQRLDGDAAETLPTAFSWAATPDEDGRYRWRTTVPKEALPDGDNVQIRLRASVTGPEADDQVFQTEPLTVTVANRAPVFTGDQAAGNGKATIERKIYYGIPGRTEDTRVSLDLSSLAEDPDGDGLTYAIDEAVSDSVRACCELSGETGRLSVALTDELIAMRTVTLPVTVEDGHQGSLQMEAVIRLKPFEDILKTFRLVPVSLNGESIPAGLQSMTGTLGVNTLVYRLEGDLEGYAEARRQDPSIPPITEWLELSVDENAADKDELRWGGDADQPELSLSLREITKRQTVSPDLTAVISDQTGDLRIPVEVGPISVIAENSPPQKTELAPSGTITRKAGMGGTPGHYEATTFGRIFEGETTELSRLFTDAETPETLICFVRTDAPVDLPPEISDLDGALPDGLPVYALEGTDDLLSIVVTRPGNYNFEVFAWDGEYVSAPVCYTVAVTSLFWRNVTIALIALAAALLLLIVGLALRYAMLPSFAGMALDIDRDHRGSTIGQPSAAYSTLALAPYRKKPVSLMTALIASGQFPPSAVPPEALTDILLFPGTNRMFGIGVGARAAQAGVRVRAGSQTLEGRGRLKRIAFQQPVQILMEQERITLIVKAVRESSPR